jgi:hypothetical protein
MIKLSTAEKIRRAAARGWDKDRICKTYSVEKPYVTHVLWSAENAERRKKWMRERAKRLYWADPEFRAKKIAETLQRRKARST